MKVDVDSAAPESVEAELLAVPFGGALSAVARRLDGLLGGALARLVESGEAKAGAGASVVLHLVGDEGIAARRVALVGADGTGEDAVRTAAAAAVRAAN